MDIDPEQICLLIRSHRMIRYLPDPDPQYVGTVHTGPKSDFRPLHIKSSILRQQPYSTVPYLPTYLLYHVGTYLLTGL